MKTYHTFKDAATFEKWLQTKHDTCHREMKYGGWDTMTTRARMSEYLPEGVSVGREKGISYVFDRKNGDSKIPLSDGMLLKGYTV